MNYIRGIAKHIYLASIDFESNALDYALFNKENQNKSIEQLKEELNNYSIKNYFAIIEKNTNKLVGIVGFKNLIQANQRANIDLILNDELGKEKKLEYGKEALDGISIYAYVSMNLYNLLCEETNFDSCQMYQDAGYEYIGTRHNTVLKENKLGDLHLFQRRPDITFTERTIIRKETNYIIPASLIISELPQIVTENNVTLVRPSKLNWKEKNDIRVSLGNSLNDFYDSSCMGEYKMIYNDYRLSKKMDDKNGFDYFILNENGKTIGYVDRLHINNKNLSTDIEINIFDKSSRKKGYGTKAYQAYVKTLRQIGYVSVGSVVFGFNESSKSLHKTLGFNKYAIRNKSYFADGKLQDMHYYEADLTNDLGYSKSKGGM